jgi:integrase
VNTLQTPKVLLFNNNSIYNAITTFVDEKESPNTRKNYSLWINHFFNTILNKKLSQLTWDDILNITHQDLRTYRQYLQTINGNNTVNQKIACLSSLWGELKKHNNNINLTVAKVDLLSIVDHSWGSLTENEIMLLYKFCRERDYKPEVQETFFRTCFVTGIRSNPLMMLKKENLIQEKDFKSGSLVWCICVVDKKKHVKKAISNKLYNQIIECQEPQSLKIFNVCDKMLRQTLKSFCSSQNIHNDRRIVLHSLKKSSMDFVWDTTQNIIKTAKQGQHSSIETTYKHYIGKNESLSDQPSYDLFDKEYNIKQLEHLTKEQLLDLIKDDSSVLKQLIYNLNDKEQNKWE